MHNLTYKYGLAMGHLVTWPGAWTFLIIVSGSMYRYFNSWLVNCCLLTNSNKCTFMINSTKFSICLTFTEH